MCGALNDVAFTTCIRCGERLTTEAQRAAARPPPSRRLDDTPPSGLGRAAMLLGGLCAAVFAFQLSMALKHGQFPIMGSGLTHAENMRSGVVIPVLELVKHQPWRLLSAVFAHFGLLHFGMNMLGFLNLSRTAEALVGSGRTIITFVLTGVVGFATTMMVNELSGGVVHPTAGASGGILGVMGLLLAVLIRRGNPAWKSLMMNTIFYVVLFGFAMNVSGGPILINNSAHLGGLGSGFLLGLLWSKQGAAETFASKAVAAVALAASVVSIGLALKS